MPPVDKSKLDQTLEEFLKQQSDDRRQGYTLAELHLKVHEFLRMQKLHSRRLDSLEEREVVRDERIEEAHDRLDAHRTAIVAVKRVLRKNPAVSEKFDADEMDTGQFDLASIQREVNEQKLKRMNSERVKADNATWFKRHIITISFTAIGTVLAALFVLFLQLALAGLKK